MTRIPLRMTDTGPLGQRYVGRCAFVSGTQGESPPRLSAAPNLTLNPMFRVRGIGERDPTAHRGAETHAGLGVSGPGARGAAAPRCIAAPKLTLDSVFRVQG